VFARINTGGKQYKIKEGQTVRVENLGTEVGGDVEIKDVLLVETDEAVMVGTPFIHNAAVKATVVEVGKGDKTLVFKKKKRKQYKRTRGHRQEFTALKIEKIEVQGE
jgi:large subunit ribosomal protein L21